MDSTSERFGCRTQENVVSLQMEALFIAFPSPPHPLDIRSSYGLYQPEVEPSLNLHRKIHLRRLRQKENVPSYRYH